MLAKINPFYFKVLICGACALDRLFGVNVINSPARAQGLLKGREEGRKREALVGVPCFSSPPLPSYF